MSPDLLLFNARALLLDANETVAEAVLVRDGRILALGDTDKLRALARPGAKSVNLNGMTLLPGFFDAHCHVLGFGLVLGQAQLNSARSVPDVVQLLREHLPHTPLRGWLRGRGYDHNTFPDKGHPTRHDIDALAPDVPVLLTHASGHAVVVNTRALRLAGIGNNTPDPPGGTIVRDERGEPNGVLLENALLLAEAAAPAPSDTEKVAALERAGREMHRMGITSAADAGLPLADLALFHQAALSKNFTLRVAAMPLLPELQNGANWLSPAALADCADGEWVTIGPAKLYSDGAIGTRTALLRAPYADNTGNQGTAIWDSEQLNALITGAHRAGWQIAIHAIGDAAINLCLNAFGSVPHPREDARHRLEHAMLLHDDQLERMNALGVVPIFQPEFIARFGDAYRVALSETRARRLMPYRAVQKAGLPLVFSSDLPVVPGSPLDGVRAAVERRAPSGTVLDAAQSVTVADALRAYTQRSAWSVFAERDRGTLLPGQRADFAVLSADPLTLPVTEWHGALSVQATIVGGEVVFGHL